MPPQDFLDLPQSATQHAVDVDTPIGTVTVVAAASDELGAVTTIRLPSSKSKKPPTDAEPALPVLAEAAIQIRQFFAGERRVFDLPLAPGGTPFQRTVWAALCEIPFGRTTSYGAIAARIEQPTAVRAVGAANGRNPLSIVVPCHRVIGANGKLTGYASGLDTKRWLLEHESGDLLSGLAPTSR